MLPCLFISNAARLSARDKTNVLLLTPYSSILIGTAFIVCQPAWSVRRSMKW